MELRLADFVEKGNPIRDCGVMMAVLRTLLRCDVHFSAALAISAIGVNRLAILRDSKPILERADYKRGALASLLRRYPFSQFKDVCERDLLRSGFIKAGPI